MAPRKSHKLIYFFLLLIDIKIISDFILYVYVDNYAYVLTELFLYVFNYSGLLRLSLFLMAPSSFRARRMRRLPKQLAFIKEMILARRRKSDIYQNISQLSIILPLVNQFKSCKCDGCPRCDTCYTRCICEPYVSHTGLCFYCAVFSF